MPFNLLIPPIRKYIRDQRWESLRPIQNAAIQRILTTDHNYILASRTASGKTEAAFLPILSKLDFNEPGVQVLYISPLVALINDQFNRVEELCKYLDVSVTKWHGEAKRSLKNKLIKNPQGVVLITPESLEAMFINKPYNVKHLFENLRFVVIDEIHAFIGTDRGTQLKSILARLGLINLNHFRVIGLSATIGPDGYTEAKRFTGDESNTKILLDREAKEMDTHFRYFASKEQALPLELLKDLYLEVQGHKALIFPNSRGRVEEVAVKLKKIAKRVHGHSNYFSHHSSVDKEVREYVEYFAKNNTRDPFSIACTSTLELGIDIGSVDKVVQIDATFSIASLIQRVGRSGRKDFQKSNLFLYATSPWSLLQSLACYSLYQEGFIEPPHVIEQPYDLLLHQALSIVKGHSGIKTTTLTKQLRDNHAFKNISTEEIEEIINHLITVDFLEKLRYEVIIGVEGEKTVNSRDFYSVFKTEEDLQVSNNGNKIGTIPYSPQVREDENIILAARLWKIKFVDLKSNKIEVVAANDGKAPTFYGGGANIHLSIREKMFDILFSKKQSTVLNKASSDILAELRKDFSCFKIQNPKIDRPLLSTNKNLTLYTFTGTRINQTISFLLKLQGINNTIDDRCSGIEITDSTENLLPKWDSLTTPLKNIDPHIEAFLEEAPGILSSSKWGQFLPLKYQVKLLKQKYFDFPGAKSLLHKVNLIKNSSAQ